MILARELSLDEIREIRAKTPKELELEAFVHGAMCMAYSGRCFLSANLTGRDGNRGKCAQPCRWAFNLYVEETTIEKVLNFLKNNKFIDDKLLAQKIVNTNINLNKYGKNKIKQNLYNKGLDYEDISNAISNINPNVEFENAMHLAKKRYERIKNDDKRKIYQKISQHLAYKGFSYDTIKSVLNKILNFDEYEY